MNRLGLTAVEVKAARSQYGSNTLQKDPHNRFLSLLIEIISEPMFLLLTIATVIYFLLGETTEGFMLVIAIFFVTGISIYQSVRSRNATKALEQISQLKVKVYRDGKLIEINKSNLVVGDHMILEEGDVITADATILDSFDFSVNESILTGESFAVAKPSGMIYNGTMVVSGSASARVVSVGSSTELGKLDLSMQKIKNGKTLLQKQIDNFVKGMTLFGTMAFVVVWFLNYITSGDVLESLLRGLTLAMSALPEEIPVAFSTFLALGAWRLIRKNVLTKQPQTVESLGAASVICLDKTGTITENTMVFERIYNHATSASQSISGCNDPGCQQVLQDAMLSSEITPFDPMEIAIHKAYKQYAQQDITPGAKMLHEYPLSGTPPIMTHVFETDDGIKVAAKGGWEHITRVCRLDAPEIARIKIEADAMAKLGMRVLGTAHASYPRSKEFPENQDDFGWNFSGLIALSDPPKKNISQVISQFYDAGVSVKMITGDYPDTAIAIAQQSGFKNTSAHLTGSEVMQMSDEQLQLKIDEIDVFARMFPEAKLRIIKAYKKQGQVVAMTGDGVNDAPALKAADIGIAMGQRGTGIAREAAKMILTDDNLQNMVQAIETGRRIYHNLKKAFRYIITIHIPIILVVTLPLLLGWKFPNIFTPIHVIFLELIMGPTCSIIYENEPIEKGLIMEGPRKTTESLFSWRELWVSVLQGLIISTGVLFTYQFFVYQNADETSVRTLTFTTLIFSNIFLTLVNRSFTKSIFETIRYKNKLIPLILLITLLIWLTTVKIPFVQKLFRFSDIGNIEILFCALTAAICVFWIEISKASRRRLKP
ncbi:MAG: cation-translocating P-type ATPase [Saprospiraceae bacterium]|nr:cation-translocating P-type ATPase [Saprospiraceae bacterium]